MSQQLRQMTESHLGELAEEIWRGRCIAFVGAGFSAAAQLPGWVELLRDALALVPMAHRNYSAVQGTLQSPSPSSRELEAAGQLIQDAIGVTRFREVISESLAVDESSLDARYLQRRRMLRELPFRAILTTNFDPLLPGSLPTAEGYRRLLRDSTGGPWDPCYWPGGEGPQVMQVHGAVGTDQLVFARRDYRELLFRNPGYLTFLRALFATKTVLFMGFSFRDAYVDLLRAELMALIERPGTTGAVEPPVLSYAMMTDLSEAEATYFREHEGMRVLWFEKTAHFSGMDRLLEELVLRTNPLRRLQGRLEKARVLWFDPKPKNNVLAIQHLGGEGGECFHLVTEVVQARKLLTERRWDLVLSHWGHRKGELSSAQCLLEWMHSHAIHVPVVIFSRPEFAHENKPKALAWGATDMASSWVELFRSVDRVLPAAGVGGR
jgi:hypothetical protein